MGAINISVGSKDLWIIDISRASRPFRFVFLSNYTMLIFGGLIALSGAYGVTVSLFTGQFSGALLATFLGLFYSYVTWIGWQHRNILDIPAKPYRVLQLMVIAAISTGFAALFLTAGMEDESAWMLTFMTGAIAITVLTAGLALVYARTLSISGLNIRLIDFLKWNNAYEKEHDPHFKFPPSNRGRGILFVVLWALCLAGLYFVPQDYHFSAIAIWALLLRARQEFQPNYQAIMVQDRRPPILFLRSFVDDEKIHYTTQDSQFFDFSLESRLGKHFTTLGPFIAVGAPRDSAPHLGAARVKLSDAEWQERVIQWVNGSQAIILMAGTTHWIEWELETIVRLGHAGKLIVMFPQLRKIRRKANAAKRLAAVRTAFAGTIWEIGLGHLENQDAAHIRSLVFHSTGVAAVTSKTRNRDSYNLAALIAHNLLLQGKNASPSMKASSAAG